MSEPVTGPVSEVTGRPGTGPRIRVAVVDDQELVRTGLRMILEQAPDLTVVGEARDGAQAVAMVSRDRPDVVLMDIRMPVMDGIEATHRICGDRTGHANADGGDVATGGAARVLVLTTFDLDEYVYAALQAGASGFLLKDVLAKDLHTAVRVVHAGDAVTSPAITRRLIAHFTGTFTRPPRRDDGPLAPLTPREVQILTLITHGLTNAEIAADLVLAEGTVKAHVSHILTKLGLRDRVQAVILGHQTGLADLPPARPDHDRGPGLATR